MKTQSADTSARVERVVLEAYRRMTPRQRADCVRSMNEALVVVARAGIRARHGAISEAEMRLRLGALWLGRDAMVRWFGWDPDVEGY